MHKFKFKTMSINKVAILFYIHRTRINKNGLCPLKCRITYLKRRKEFSTGLIINPDYWNSKKQKAFIPNDNENLNNQLSLIKNKINQVFLFLSVNEGTFDVEDVYLKFKGKDSKKETTILKVFELHNERIKKQIGIGYTEGTYKKYVQTNNHLKNFIKSKYKKSDFLLDQLSLKFIEDFSFYLIAEKRQKQITVNRTNRRLKKVIKLAISERFLEKDPFIGYKSKRVITEIVFLSAEELKTLEDYDFKQKRLKQIRDMFIFCCYTGLAYLEMSTLNSNNIKKGFDGNLWIEMYRQKTNKSFFIPLLPKAEKILIVYNNELPKVSNQKFNLYLKEIADIIGIRKRLTHHTARKTFATTVLLNNNVSMEVVSELLGHSSVLITQKYYAKLVKTRIANEIKILNKKLE